MFVCLCFILLSEFGFHERRSMGNFMQPSLLACVTIAGTATEGQVPGTFTGAIRVLCVALKTSRVGLEVHSVQMG